MSFKIGDRVAVVEDTRDGIVVQVLAAGKIVVEIDGFDWEFSENELVGIEKIVITMFPIRNSSKR